MGTLAPLRAVVAWCGAMWKLLLVAGIVLAAVVIAASFGLMGEEEFEGGPRCPECELAVVERMVDGDTLAAGGRLIRLYGVDAPELGERCGNEAARRLRELSGSRVRLEGGPRPYDQHDRRLAYLYTEDGRSIDAALVWGGYARAWTRDGQHRAELLLLERDAQAEGRGCLW